MTVNLVSCCFPHSRLFSVDDAFVQTIKGIFGGDESKKNLVDPFLEARFAGKKVTSPFTLDKTATFRNCHRIVRKLIQPPPSLPLQLCTQIIEKNANPEWNQVLNLQVKVISLECKTAVKKQFFYFYLYVVWHVFCFYYSSHPCVSVSNWPSSIGKSLLIFLKVEGIQSLVKKFMKKMIYFSNSIQIVKLVYYIHSLHWLIYFIFFVLMIIATSN